MTRETTPATLHAPRSTTHDAIVIGAGPAGSTAARLLARGGARVLLLDKARFPRDKPCGGGVTFRADDECGLDLAPVTEREIYGVRISLTMGRAFERTSERLLARMTQRARLDAYLAEHAARAGADVRDGAAAEAIEIEDDVARVRCGGGTYTTHVLIGADGVNGATASAAGLQPMSEAGVAFEANYPLNSALASRWSRFIGIDLRSIYGGYGWVFPKGDHLNIGVGGFSKSAPALRAWLSKYCAYLGLDERLLFGRRGYQLPLRRDRALAARGPVMLAGDAASLVDPLSGEGIWAAFVSGRLAAEEAVRLLDGQVADLRGYQAALDGIVGADIIASRRLQLILERLPHASVMLLKHSGRLWRYVSEIMRGELTYDDLPRKLGPLRHVYNRWGDAEIALHRRATASQPRIRPRSAAVG